MTQLDDCESNFRISFLLFKWSGSLFICINFKRIMQFHRISRLILGVLYLYIIFLFIYNICLVLVFVLYSIIFLNIYYIVFIICVSILCIYCFCNYILLLSFKLVIFISKVIFLGILVLFNILSDNS